MRPAVAIALLLLAGPAALAQTPGPAPGPDLALEALHVPEAPVIVDGVGQAEPEQVIVTVRNRGPSAVTGYQILYRWVANGAESPLNGGAPASMDVREERLDPNQVRTHTFDWRLQPGQAGAGTVKAIVQVGGNGQSLVDATPGDNQRGRDVHVDAHGVALTLDGQDRAIHPGETLYVRGQVQNLGNVAEMVTLQTQADAGGPLLTAVDPPSLVLAAGASAPYLAFLTMPAEDPQPFAKTVSLQALPRVGAPRQAMTGMVESTFAAYAPDDHVFSVTGGDGTFFAATDRPARAAFTVRNEGRQPDIYVASAPSPDGWELSVAPARLVLDPQETQTVTVTALPRAGAQAVLAAVTVASLHPVDARSAALALRPSGVAPEVRAAEPEVAPLYVGDGLRLRVVLANPGDQLAPAAPLAVRLHGPQVEVQQSMEAPPLGPGASQDVLLDLGAMSRGGLFQLAVTWSPGGHPASLHSSLHVRDPRLQVTPPTPAEGLPGQEVGYLAGSSTFRLRNVGADAEEWLLRVAAPAGSASLAGVESVLVLPGQTRSVAARQVLPALDGANATVAPLTLHATIAGRPHLQWEATVPTRVADRLAPAVVVPVQAASWSVRDALPVRALVEDLSAIRSATVLVGTGSLNWSVPMVALGDGAWWANVTFREAGRHVLRVQGVDAAGNAGSSPPWTMDVAPGPRPRLQVPRVPANGSWDLADPVEVVVEGPPATQLRYQVRQDGRIVATGNQTLAGDRAFIPLAGAAPGEALLQVEAVAAGGNGQVLVLLHLETAPGNRSADPPESIGGDLPAEAPGPAAVLIALAFLAAGSASRRRRP